MNSNEHSKVIAFDTLFCTNHIQMLKVIMSYLDNRTQKSMAIYIKFLELNYTIEYFKRNPYSLCSCMEREGSPDISKMCAELLPYCTEKEQKQIEQLRGMLQSVEMYKEMSKTMDALKEFMPEMTGSASSSEDNGSFDMMNMLMNMLTPEQRQMFDMFGGNLNAE